MLQRLRARGSAGRLVPLLVLVAIAGCRRAAPQPADLLLVNGSVYTLAWGDPAPDGTPAADAPHTASGWHPEAQAIAVRGGTIVFVGTSDGATSYRAAGTRVIDLHGATVVPGLIESHVHIEELGHSLARVDLRGLDTEAAIVEKVRAAAATRPAGTWIEGYGWDDGAWAAHLPTGERLSKAVPDHPVYLRGLHGFSVWGNRLALARAGIDRDTKAPSDGTIVKNAAGEPTGILTNRAVALLESAVPSPTATDRQELILAGLRAVAGAGYVSVEEAGADAGMMAAFETLDRQGRLLLRVYAMLAARDTGLMRDWLTRGPQRDVARRLVVPAVKVFYDGALGSRGALLLADYSDRPGWKGVKDATFDEEQLARAMRAGFQLSVHAIGDAANRRTLDFFEGVFRAHPELRANRHRIEHAQLLAAADIPRFASLGILASMQPPHAIEDKGWAQDRVGPERIRGAYAWRSLRLAGARLAFNSDLPGTDYDFFYGFHSAITRQDRRGEPQGGWFPDQRMTPEEALRGYTCWGAYAQFSETLTGTLQAGKWADITVLSLDPLNVGERNPPGLFGGKVLYTIAGGRVVFERR